MNINKTTIVGALFILGCHIGLTGCSTEDFINETPTEEEQNPSDKDDSDDTETTDPENPKPDKPEEFVRMTFTSVSSNSRASVVEDSNNGSKNILRWDAGDMVRVMTGNNMNDLTECKFYTSEGGESYAFFEYIGPSVATKTYFGIHNGEYYKDGSQIRFSIPTGNGDTPLCQKLKNSSIHLNGYRPMYTNIQTSEENLNELTGLYFRHLSSLLVFNIINSSGKEFTTRSIKTKVVTGTPFYNEGVRLISEMGQGKTKSSPIYKEAKFSDFILLNLGENGSGLKSGINEKYQAFQSLLPVDFTDKTATDIKFILNIDGKEIESLSLPSTTVKRFEAGKYYKINLRVLENDIGELIITTDIQDWEEGGSIIIPVG